jgi:4-amino-4-deoxy-L-arabinose transferase-like glycosyltransferase
MTEGDRRHGGCVVSIVSSEPSRFAAGTRPWRVASLARAADSSLFCGSLLVLLCLALFFYGLSGIELWRTENLRARIAQEMMAAGDWIVPRLYGEPLFTKPPGMYIAVVLCSLPFGEVTELSARLPSALGATAAVLLFYWYVRRQLGRLAGLVAAIILPMSALWLDKAPSAEIDALQVAWVLASIVFFLRATEDETQPARCFGWWLAALLCVAGGVLTKWTGPEFFYGMAIPFLWWRGRLRWLWSWQHLTSAALAATICLGWVAAAVWLEGWSTFWNTFEREAFSRLVPGYSERPYPFLGVLMHPGKLFVTSLPWSALALVALRPSFMDLWDERGRRLLQAFHCWVWPQVVFWSLITEHTARHSFPLFPGIAGLAAMVWFAWHTGRLPSLLPRVRPMQVLTGCLVLWMILKLAFVHHLMPARNAHRQPRAKGALLASRVPAEATLYLFRLKDEGILFYFARPAYRLPSPLQLPNDGRATYCILCLAEWHAWNGVRPAEVVERFTDEQGDPIVLIRILPG